MVKCRIERSLVRFRVDALFSVFFCFCFVFFLLFLGSSLKRQRATYITWLYVIFKNAGIVTVTTVVNFILLFLYIIIILVASHFVSKSFRTQVISYLLWSFRTYFLVSSYPVTTISYPGHVVPILVISYLGQLGTKWLYGGQFVPKSFRTHFGHFVPNLVISYAARMDGWMDRWTNKRTGVFW